jgi:hypothetical protein
MSESEYYKKLATESILKNYALSFATPHVGLAITGWSVSPSSEITGELVAVGYRRAVVEWSDFVADMSNTNEVLWSVDSAWPQIRGVFISDSFQGGKVLLYDSISSKDFELGDIAAVNIGNLLIT